MKGLTFSTPLVLKVLDGSKTVTRRVLKHPHISSANELDVYSAGCDDPHIAVFHDFPKSGIRIDVRAPYQPGEIVYLRETWCYGTGPTDDSPPNAENSVIVYRAKWDADPEMPSLQGVWKSPRFMPEWASRQKLVILSVRPERLQEITCDEVRLEGLEEGCPIPGCKIMGKHPFVELWNSLHKPPFDWAGNPYVFRIEFRRTP